MDIRKIIKEEIDGFEWTEDQEADITVGLCVQREELDWDNVPVGRKMVQYTVTEVDGNTVWLTSPEHIKQTRWLKGNMVKYITDGYMTVCQNTIKEEVDDFDWADDITPQSSSDLDWSVSYDGRGTTNFHNIPPGTDNKPYELSKEFGDKLEESLRNWYHHNYSIERVQGSVSAKESDWIGKIASVFNSNIPIVDYYIDINMNLNNNKLIHYNGTYIGLYDNPDGYHDVDDLDEDERLITHIHFERPKRNFNPKVITDWMTEVLSQN
jgi:hypothetical protein